MAAAGKTFWWNTGAVAPALAAALSWFCCLPLGLGLVGTGAAALGARFAPWRPYLLGASAVFLALAFYQAYRPLPPEEACSAAGSCAPSNRRRQLILVWLIAIVTGALATAPYWADRVIYWFL